MYIVMTYIYLHLWYIKLSENTVSIPMVAMGKGRFLLAAFYKSSKIISVKISILRILYTWLIMHGCRQFWKSWKLSGLAAEISKPFQDIRSDFVKDVFCLNMSQKTSWKKKQKMVTNARNTTLLCNLLIMLDKDTNLTGNSVSILSDYRKYNETIMAIMVTIYVVDEQLYMCTLYVG